MSQFTLIAETSKQVAATSARGGKVRALAECLRNVAEAESELAVLYLSGETRQGKIGVGAATLYRARDTAAAAAAQLSLHEFDAALEKLAAIKGAGAATERTQQLHALFARCTALEQEFLLRLLTGELRQGALAGVMIDGARITGARAGVGWRSHCARALG